MARRKSLLRKSYSRQSARIAGRKAKRKVRKENFGPLAKEYFQSSKHQDPHLQDLLAHCTDADGRFENKSEVRRACGVSTSTLHAWETGKTRRPNISTMDFVLRAFGLGLAIVKNGRKVV